MFDDTLRTAYLITRTGKPEFRELYTLNEIPFFADIFKGETENDSVHLPNAIVSTDSTKFFPATNGAPEVAFSFNAPGARKWEIMTRKNIGRYLAILLHNIVITAPRVNQAITGGKSSISGGFMVADAQLLAGEINSASLPVKINIIKADVTSENIDHKRKLILIIVGAFVVASVLGCLVFNALKSR